MPPKKAPAPSKKAEVKKKEKIIEDKTFGMKNKKGGKAQKFIAQVEKQVKSGGAHPLDKTAELKKLEKEKKEKEQKEMAALFKPVQTQSVAAGTDPKSVVCAFFKQGNCGKGNKCKFSHDLSVERKTEKRSIYCDMRDVDDADGETMENWTEDKLNEVVNKKHGGKEKTMPTTTIICKYFLDAVEKRLYGWFWECPNGLNCIYRHALPQGYVLKRDQKKDDKKDQISLDELIEKERAKLSGSQTRVTLESFLAWKKRKIQEKKDAARKEEDKKRKDYNSGRSLGLSGREMFSFNPELANDGDMEDGDVAIDSYAYNQDEEDAEVQYKELDLNALMLAGLESDGTGTVAENDRLEKIKETVGDETPSSSSAEELPNGGKDQVDATPFNENLFLEEDLEGLDDELNDLDLNDAS